jgi:hypothetical protein
MQPPSTRSTPLWKNGKHFRVFLTAFTDCFIQGVSCSAALFCRSFVNCHKLTPLKSVHWRNNTTARIYERKKLYRAEIPAGSQSVTTRKPEFVV